VAGAPRVWLWPRRVYRVGGPPAAWLPVAGRGEERDARFSRSAAGAQAADRSGAPDPRAGWTRPAAADPRPRYGARHGRGRGPRPRGSGDGHQVRRADAQHHPRRGRCLDPERGASRRRGVSRGLCVAAETFVARLDRVPLNRFHWRLLILSGLGWMFDAMDVLMLSFLLTPVRAEFKLDATGVGLVASATFVGMFIGAAAAGRLADRYGRRTVFTTTLVIFSIRSPLHALAPTSAP